MTDAPLKLSVRADLFRIAQRFAADRAFGDDDITGVRIEPSTRGVVLVSMDARRMIVLRDETGAVSRPVTLRVPRPMMDAMKSALRAHEGVSDRVRLIVEGDQLRIDPRTADAFAATISERATPFPEWRTMLPKRANGAPLPLSVEDCELAAVTARALAQANGWSRDAALQARATLRRSMTANVLTFTGAPDAFAVFAGTPGEIAEWSQPMWLVRPPAAPAEHKRECA
jgi:hypothetical protein